MNIIDRLVIDEIKKIILDNNDCKFEAKSDEIKKNFEIAFSELEIKYDFIDGFFIKK